MGFYESIHDCGDGEYCVTIGSSIDNFSSIQHVITCSKCNPKIGSKFKYDLSEFIKKHSKNISDFTQKIYDIEVIDYKPTEVKGGYLNVIRMKTNLNCNLLNKSTQIFYTIYDNVPSWIDDGNGNFIITFVYTHNVGPQIHNNNLWFFWNSYKLMDRNTKYQIRKFKANEINYFINNEENKGVLILDDEDDEFEIFDIYKTDDKLYYDDLFKKEKSKIKLDDSKIIYEKDKIPNNKLNNILDKIKKKWELEDDIEILKINEISVLKYYMTDYKGNYFNTNIFL